MAYSLGAAAITFGLPLLLYIFAFAMMLLVAQYRLFYSLTRSPGKRSKAKQGYLMPLLPISSAGK
jgi:hypothetical protein